MEKIELEMNYYIQTKNVDWVDSDKGTIWVHTKGSEYLTVLDPEKRTNLGVDLNLVEQYIIVKNDSDSFEVVENPDFVWRETKKEDLYLNYIMENLCSEQMKNTLEEYLSDNISESILSDTATDNDLMSMRTFNKKIAIWNVF